MRTQEEREQVLNLVRRVSKAREAARKSQDNQLMAALEAKLDAFKQLGDILYGTPMLELIEYGIDLGKCDFKHSPENK